MSDPVVVVPTEQVNKEETIQSKPIIHKIETGINTPEELTDSVLDSTGNFENEEMGGTEINILKLESPKGELHILKLDGGSDETGEMLEAGEAFDEAGILDKSDTAEKPETAKTQDESHQANVLTLETPPEAEQPEAEQPVIEQPVIEQPKPQDQSIEIPSKMEQIMEEPDIVNSAFNENKIQLSPKSKAHRETQTFEVKSVSCQSKNDAGTQMARKDLYIDNSGDREVVPGPYFDSEALLKVQIECAITIQCAARVWKANKTAKVKMLEKCEMDEYKRKLEWEKLHDGSAEKKEEERKNPKTKKNFKVLEAEILEWRKSEERRIIAEISDPEERRLQRIDLLEKETRLIRELEKLRVKAKKNNEEDYIFGTIHEMISPQKWMMKSGEVVETKTIITERAEQLAQLFEALKLKKVKLATRASILENTREAIKDCHHLESAPELFQLIERELDMISRKRGASSVKGLRKRIETLFLQLLLNPDMYPKQE